VNRRLAAWLVGIALAGKLVLLAVLVWRGSGPAAYIDSETYLAPARALLETGRFAASPERPAEPELVRTPGYPAFLALVLAVFGNRIWVVSAVGAILSAATALALLFLFSGPFGTRAAAWAAVLLSFEPGSFCRSLDVLSETLFTLLLVLGLAALVAFVGKVEPRPASAFLGGLALALATLVRPILVCLLPVLALWLIAVASLRRWPGRRSAGALLAFLLGPVILVGGWMTRNAVVAGAFSLVPLSGHQLLHHLAAGVVARVEGIPLTRAQEQLGIREAFFRFRGPHAEADLFGKQRYRDLYPETADLGTFALDRQWRRKAMEVFRAHPVVTLAVTARQGLLLLLSPPSLILSTKFGLVRPDPEIYRLYYDQQIGALARALARRYPVLFAVSALLVVQLAAFFGLALLGAVRCWRPGSRAAHALLLVTVTYLVAASSSSDVVDDRFRVPLMPVICLYLAAGSSPPNVSTMGPP
jgi:4-amino-4-deoxy-L-arabinose transferase-like glycosyltransferase